MKVVKATGLVPVKGIGRGHRHPRNVIFGLTPDKARAGILAKEVSLAEIDDGIETYEVDGPRAVVAVAPVVTEDLIPIPAEWSSWHHLPKIKLAKRLVPDHVPEPDGKWTEAGANAVIAAEVQRRAAADHASS